MTDPISDMLTRIRNAHSALLPTVEMPYSRIKENIAAILKKEGYISEISADAKGARTLKLTLKYTGKRGVIEGVRRISTPGLRRYVGSTEIPRVHGGLGIAIVSTSQGVMSGHEARKKKVGGELVCYVW
jgi:small subunit ribosomal protein S8